MIGLSCDSSEKARLNRGDEQKDFPVWKPEYICRTPTCYIELEEPSYGQE